MRLDDIHHYDTYVPILAELADAGTRGTRRWTSVLAALEPLGSDYCGALEQGLSGRWCDRYENRGKQSGAFSSGSYDGDPYILMNYQPDVLDHVFTLAHEAGHSMHSWLFGPAPAVRLLQLHDLRGRGGQHVQRAALEPLPLGERPRTTSSGRSSSTARSTPCGHDLPPDDVRRVREAGPRLGRGGRAADGGTVQAKSTAGC